MHAVKNDSYLTLMHMVQSMKWVGWGGVGGNQKQNKIPFHPIPTHSHCDTLNHSITFNIHQLCFTKFGY